MLRFANVTKKYHGHNALENLSFELEHGEMAFLTGHSGAGKTTLLKLIMMIERCTSGQVFVDDKNIQQFTPRDIPALRRRIGMIFQTPQLLETRTVFENIALPLFISGYRHTEIKRRVRAALDKVGLLHKEQAFPLALSCGEQQRVSIARAIVNKPTIVLADEPTGNLDPELSMDIMRLFEAFNAVGVTILIATHDLSMVAALNRRLITLEKGKLVHETTS